MKRTLLPLACAALTLAGCGSSSSSTTTTNKPAPAQQATPAPNSGGGGTVEVKLQNIQFAPKSATVKVGQKVHWVNEDTVDHNVTATGGASFKSNDFGKGGTYEFTAKKAGVIKYTCTLHPGMDAQLTVTG